jgi:hypothetical protein
MSQSQQIHIDKLLIDMLAIMKINLFGIA